MGISNLSANNSAEAIRRYRDNYDRIFRHERDITDAVEFMETWKMPKADAEILIRMWREGSDDALRARLNYKRNFDLIYDKGDDDK